MPIITYKVLSGITATIIPDMQFVTITSYGPAPTQITLPSGSYTLLFGNAGGMTSYDPVTPATADFGTYYYELDGTGGTPGNGDPYVMAVGFDSIADEIVPVLFQARKGDGEFTEALPPIASGTFTDTLNFAFTLTPPASDGVTQTSAYDPAAFSFWFDLYNGQEQIVVDFKGHELGESLAIPPGTSAIYLAIYVAPLKSTSASTGPVVGPIKVASDCPALLANAAAAQQVYGAAQGSATAGAGALTLLKNFADAAELGAAPCKASELKHV